MTTQIAVKLSDALVRQLDDLVASGSFDSRSDAVRRGIEALVAQRSRQLVDAAFAEGFARHPDTEDEIADATRLAVDAINNEPWEKWW